MAFLHMQFDAYLSSPLQRAVASCQIIKETLNQEMLPLVKRENLIEREFGEADGIKITDAVYERILKDDFKGIEKSIDIQKRATTEIFEIAKLYPNQKILIVTHSHFIKALFTTLDSHLTFRSTLANGSLNYVEIEDGKIVNFYFNK